MTIDPDRDRREQLASLAEAIVDLDHPIKRDTAEWASQNLAGRDMVAADRDSIFDSDGFRRCGERGIFAMMAPIEFGGTDETLATTLLTLEGLGLGSTDRGLNYAVVSQMLSTQVALSRFGSADQKAEFLPGLVDGTRHVAFAMTEPAAGSDAFSMQATATETADGTYRISGHKSTITFGPICDAALVFAKTDPDAGNWGISAFLVPADASGFERSPVRAKMGMRTTPFGDLRLDDVEVPASAMLGRKGAGASIFAAVLEVERAYVFITQVGAMERELADTIEFATTRVQGGHPISGHQSIAHRIVDMKQRHETARLFVYKAAMASVAGTDVTMASALAKIVACDAGIASALDAVSIHGARGYVTEYEVERSLRDAVGGLVYSGTSDVQRNIAARLLGLGS